MVLNSMRDPGHIKGQCQTCGGHLEFPASGMGMTVDCPHCGVRTTLVPEPPDGATPTANPPARPKSKHPLLWGSAFLSVALATAGVAHHWSKKTEAVPPTSTHTEIPKAIPPAGEETDRLQAGPVTLQKTEGSALIYAVGTVRNNSDRQRFGVKIELDLLDDQDHKIGTAGDYIAILEPHQDRPFRALLTQPKAAKVKVAGIEEQK